MRLRAARSSRGEGGVEAVAVSSVFSTVRNDDELRAAEIARVRCRGEDVHVHLERNRLDGPDRALYNATILNAALYDGAPLHGGLRRAWPTRARVNAEVYLSQNDGTLMTMEHARRYPILTIACGPTNPSAAPATGRATTPSSSTGGTTTDLACWRTLPRESGVAVTIGGVRTNFRMPDVVSIGLGGGSIVGVADGGTVCVGPDSVGYEIARKALVFGGDTMTATDIAVRLGMAEVGDRALVADSREDVAERAMAAMRALVEDAIDVMKVSSDDVDVVLVGGGAIVLPHELAGTAEVDAPEHAGCANAIGSAISKVSGVYEALVDYDVTPRDEALAIACRCRGRCG